VGRGDGAARVRGCGGIDGRGIIHVVSICDQAAASDSCPALRQSRNEGLLAGASQGVVMRRPPDIARF
jgi:hypothetical protein